MKLNSGLMAAGAFGLSLAFTAPAWAASFGDNFTVDESCGGSGACSEGGGVLTDIDRFNFSYNAAIHQDVTGDPLSGGDDQFTEEGFLDATGWVRDDNSQPAQFLDNDYTMYALFSGTGTAEQNAAGEIEVTFTSFQIDFYMDDNIDTSFTLPGDPTTGDVTVAGNGDDNLIGSANLLITGEAFVRNSLAQGDFEISMSSFGLELFGEDFLTDPDPFYSLLGFDGNAGQLILTSGTLDTVFTATQGGSGQGFFNGAAPVPEPGTLGLLGAGLLGAVAMMRRRHRRAA